MSLLNELKRRNVFRVAIAYVVASWLLAQVLQLVFESFGTPDWVMKTVLVLMAAGLPFVLFFSWAFELTPEGLKREKDVDRTKSITPQTGKKLDGLIIGVLVLALGYFAFDKFVLDPARDAELVQATTRAVSEQAGNVTSPTEHPEQSIAVLPFVNMSDDKDYFADGLSEELLNLLVNVPGLKVAGRTSSFAFKGKNDDLRGIGEALGVANVLEGSVRRSGDRLRITAQLVKVDDGFHIWSATYDRQMADIFDIQDEVAQAITKALQLRLSPPVERITGNIDAYELYLEAIALYEANEVKQCLDVLDQAIALDPEFARAYELKAICYWFAGAFIIDNAEAQPQVYKAAIEALSLDPDLEAARAFAATAGPDWSITNEIAALESLVAAEPDNIMGREALAWMLLRAGYFSLSLAQADDLIKLEPLYAWGFAHRARALQAAGRNAEANSAWLRSAELGNSEALRFLAFDSLLAGNDEKGIDWLEKYRVAMGDDPSAVRSFVEHARDLQNGKAFLDQQIKDEISQATTVGGSIEPYLWYLVFGYMDAYWAEIDTLDGSVNGWSNSDSLHLYGVVFSSTSYRQHPRYLESAREMGVVDAWEKRGPPDHCQKVDGSWVCN